MSNERGKAETPKDGWAVSLLGWYPVGGSAWSLRMFVSQRRERRLAWHLLQPET